MEVRAYIEGTECQLRPVNAKKYIDASRSAAEKAREMGADADGEKLILGAELIALGAYDGEEKVFSDGEDALSRLTAQEIVWLAAEYFADSLPDINTAGASADGEPMMSSLRTPTQDGNRSDGAEKVTVRESVPENEDAPAKDYAAVSERLETVSKRRRRVFERAEADGREYGMSFTRRRTEAAADRADMRAISGFFERDCRRYDGSFERF